MAQAPSYWGGAYKPNQIKGKLKNTDVKILFSCCICISLIIFPDINECPNGTDTHDCVENATCTDADGSHTCSCNAGFTGDGFVACIGMIMQYVLSEKIYDYTKYQGGVRYKDVNFHRKLQLGTQK